MSKTLIYIASFVALLLSVWLWFTGQKDAGLYVGIWVPSILALGAYMEASKKKK